MPKGKFNLNQILSDASKAVADGERSKHRREGELRKISIFDLVPSEENFYSMKEIDELKTAIEIAGKVLQNLVVVPLGGGKYKIISGHRRRLASLALVEEGKMQYEFVMCDVEPSEEAVEDEQIRDGLMLIVTNSQREKTVWDKIQEVRYLREVLKKARTSPKYAAALQQIAATVFGGTEVQADGTRDFIAKVLHTSTTQIGRYDAIIRNLCPEFTEEVKEDHINVSTAYELSGLSKEEQQAAFMEYQKSGEISIKAARERKAPPAPVLSTVQIEQTENEQQRSEPPTDTAQCTKGDVVEVKQQDTEEAENLLPKAEKEQVRQNSSSDEVHDMGETIFFADVFCTIERSEITDKKSNCGNRFLKITREQLEDLKAGRLLYTGDEYGIFIELSEE